jgi:TBC1 domain family protein 5
MSRQLFLLVHEPLETSPVCAEALVEAVRTTREAYKNLLLEKMKAPDGSYDADLDLQGTTGATMKEWKKSEGLSKSASHPNLGVSSGGITPAMVEVAGVQSRPDSGSNLELNNPLSLHNEVK